MKKILKMKILIASFLIFVVIFQITKYSGAQQHGIQKSGPHNITFGKRLPLDKLVFNRTVSHPGSFLQVQKSNITQSFPLRLTFISATDNDLGGHGGYVTLEKGGPGSFNVSLKIKSQRSYGYNFTILMYGR